LFSVYDPQARSEWMPTQYRMNGCDYWSRTIVWYEDYNTHRIEDRGQRIETKTNSYAVESFNYEQSGFTETHHLRLFYELNHVFHYEGDIIPQYAWYDLAMNSYQPVICLPNDWVSATFTFEWHDLSPSYNLTQFIRLPLSYIEWAGEIIWWNPQNVENRISEIISGDKIDRYYHLRRTLWPTIIMSLPSIQSLSDSWIALVIANSSATNTDYTLWKRGVQWQWSDTIQDLSLTLTIDRWNGTINFKWSIAVASQWWSPFNDNFDVTMSIFDVEQAVPWFHQYIEMSNFMWFPYPKLDRDLSRGTYSVNYKII
jgi:hypothetical protein